MSTAIQNGKTGIQKLIESPEIQNKFRHVLKNKSAAFLTTITQLVNSNSMLKNADPISILNAAMASATMDLPINPNLGFAYILPYSVKQSDGSFKQMAQFQMGYKGFVQLAQRSGQFKTISAAAVHEGQILSEDPLNGFEFDWKNKLSDNVVGYAAHFKLLNGFEKTLYMTVDDLKKHGLKYSKTASKGTGLWNTDFDAMAQKTVLKLLLSKFAPLSVEMQQATILDQSVINDHDTMDITYADNDEVRQVTQEEKEFERMKNLIKSATTTADLMKIEKHLRPAHKELFDLKFNSLS